MHQGVQGVKFQENLLSFALFTQDLWKHVFMLKKTQKKEGIKKCITTFNTLQCGFICQHKKTILKIEYHKINLRLSIFAVYRP